MNNFTYRKDMMKLISEVMNLVSRELEEHHERVAYLAYHIALHKGLNKGVANQVAYAALFHDVGAISMDNVPSIEEIEEHAIAQASVAAKHLESVPGMEEASKLIRYAALPWRFVRNSDCDRAILEKAQMVHIADEISTFIDADVPILNQMEKIRQFLDEEADVDFCPIVSAAVKEMTLADENVWFRFMYDPGHVFHEMVGEEMIPLNATLGMARTISMLVDFRSPFTVMHSAGVEASASSIAECMGYDEKKVKMISLAGSLHDIGKMRVPRAILEKPGKLEDDEFNIIKEHAFFTYRILSRVRGFEEIAEWAGFHHEKLNGKGYPFHLDKERLSEEARIIAIADIFSALAEDRPYREGMNKDRILSIMDDMVDGGELCARIYGVLKENFERINEARAERSRIVGARYYADYNQA